MCDFKYMPTHLRLFSQFKLQIYLTDFTAIRHEFCHWSSRERNLFFLQIIIAKWRKKCGGATEATDDNVVGRMRIVRWVSKATGTRSGYVILTAFTLQQWLRERFSMLHYMYIACLFKSKVGGSKTLASKERRVWETLV
jgi:hypothetical protein